MSRTDLFDRRVEDLRAEASRLIDWCFKNAKFYKKHGAGLEADIRSFEDCAAALDAFSAGLSVVPPHPALSMELIRWTRISERMPDDGELVLLFSKDDDSPWIGYRDGLIWRGADGMPFPMAELMYWAAMPAGPATVTSPALTEESAA